MLLSNFVIRNFVIRNFVIRNFVPVPTQAQTGKPWTGLRLEQVKLELDSGSNRKIWAGLRFKKVKLGLN